MNNVATATQSVPAEINQIDPAEGALLDQASGADHEVVRQEPSQGDRVRVHMNLNTGQVAVRSFETSTDLYNKTLVQTPGPVVLHSVDLRVQDKTIDKVRDEGVRDVGAYAVGSYRGRWFKPSSKETIFPVRYNPFVCKYFFVPAEENGAPLFLVHGAKKLIVWSEQTEDGPRGRMLAEI